MKKKTNDLTYFGERQIKHTYILDFILFCRDIEKFIEPVCDSQKKIITLSFTYMQYARLCASHVSTNILNIYLTPLH